MRRHLLPGLLLVAACGGPLVPPDPAPAASTPTAPAPADPWIRPVVLPERPLTLGNPQEDVFVWPLWGSAFPLGQVAIRASLQATDGAGVVIAGPGAPSERVAVALVGAGEGWTLRETAGREVVREVAVELSGALRFEVGPASVRVVGDTGEASLELGQPLGAPGEEAAVYVTIAPGAELIVDELALDEPLPARPELGAPLRELAAARSLAVGAAVDVWPPLHDLGLEVLQGTQFDTVASTDLYWATVRGEDEDWHFAPADLAVNWATVQGQAITGMFLVWDFALPRWLDDAAARGTLGAVLDEHVETMVSRYRGRVDTWVVVNEAIWGAEDTGGGRARLAENLWLDALGPGYIERAFRVARAADPDATLIYNETGAEGLDDKSDFLYALLTELVARDVPVDGVGLQFHVHAGHPPPLDEVRANMERFAALGLDVYVTELDVSLEGLELPDDEALALQAALYGDVVETCLAVEACRGVTVFGVGDRYAWDELGDARPLMFDERWEAKPAFWEVQRALR